MKRSLFFALILAFLSATAQAEMLENGRNDRAGFLLGFGLGADVLNIRGSGNSETKAAFLGDFKIGGGLSERFLLMYDGTLQYTQINEVDYVIHTIPVALQWYVWDNFYLRPAIGFSYATASVDQSGLTVSTDSDLSVGARMTAGYDFRMGRYFALSPEIAYNYNHIRHDAGNAHAHSFGGLVSLMWFF